MRLEEQKEMRDLPLFATARPEQVERLLQGSFLQRFPAHVELVREGEPADFLHVVVDGQVEVFSRHGNRETTIAVLTKNESFILAAVLTDRLYLKSARALTPARILMIPAELVRSAIETDAGLAHALMIDLARSYRGLVKELKNQKLRSSLERLAAWLIRTDAEFGARGRFDLPYEKKVLAARIGVAPEVLSRCFRALVAYKVIVTGKTISIGDREALVKLAGSNHLIDDPEV
jgi:CRP/FNR family transcriptional activator FtrB